MPKHGVYTNAMARELPGVSPAGIGAPRGKIAPDLSREYSRAQRAAIIERFRGVHSPGRIARRVRRAIDQASPGYKNARKTLRKLRRAGLKAYHMSLVRHT